MSNRTVRVNALVQREISDILRQRYQGEAVALTVTEVRVSPDLREGRVFVAIVGSEEFATERLRWLRRNAPAIREELGKRIVLKFLPRLEYVIDESSARSARLITLLDQLDAKDKE